MENEKCIIHPERDCIGKAEAARLEGRIKALEEWKDDSKKFHNDFYEWKEGQTARFAKLDEQLLSINKNVEKLLTQQENCALKPGKRWDAIVDKAIWAVLAAVIAFVLAKIGLG